MIVELEKFRGLLTRFLAKNTSVRAILTVFFLTTASSFLCAGQPQVRTFLAKESMRPGDANTLIINVLDGENSYPDSLVLAPIDSVLGKENLLKKSGWQAVKGGWSIALDFTFFEEGNLEIPALPFQFHGADGSPFSLKTDAKNLSIIPVNITDSTALRDIKDIHLEPTSWLDHLPMLLTILAILAAAVGFIWWKMRKKGPQNPAMPTQTPQSPWEWAFSQLDILEKKSLWQAGWAKQYHTELTEILRGYLSRRFGISAFKKTSDEILAVLESTNGFPKNMAEPLRELFKTVDLVKFARAEPPNDFHQQALAATRELVRSTIPNDSQFIENQSVAADYPEFQRRIKVAFHNLPNQPHGVLAAEPTLRFAEPGRRFAAAAIDVLVWMGGSVGIVRLLWAVIDWLEFADDGKAGTAFIVLILVGGLFGFGYFFHVLMEKMGATPGKIAFHIRTMDETGEPMTLDQAKKRASMKVNPSFWEIGGFLKQTDRQMGYDRAAETVVIRR